MLTGCSDDQTRVAVEIMASNTLRAGPTHCGRTYYNPCLDGIAYEEEEIARLQLDVPNLAFTTVPDCKNTSQRFQPLRYAAYFFSKPFGLVVTVPPKRDPPQPSLIAHKLRDWIGKSNQQPSNQLICMAVVAIVSIALRAILRGFDLMVDGRLTGWIQSGTILSSNASRETELSESRLNST